MQKSDSFGTYVNLERGMALLSISSSSAASIPSLSSTSSTTLSSSAAPPSLPATLGPKTKRCLFLPMEQKESFFYPTVSTWIALGRKWSFDISQKQATKINSAILRAIEHMSAVKANNTWLPFDKNLIIAPNDIIYWRITSLTGANKETQWKIIEVCSTRGFPPVSLQVLHLNPSAKELQLCEHFSQQSMSSLGLLSLEKIGDALVSRYMQDGCLEEYIGKVSMSMVLKTSFAYQIAQGLQYLHTHKIAHRDISTRNIIIHGTQVNICDFGSACFTAEKNPEGLVPVRTSATEVLLKLDSRDLALADLYSLGIVYHCLFGSTKSEELFKSDSFCFGLIPSPEHFSMFCYKRSNIDTWPGRANLLADIKPTITKLLKESPTERIPLDSVITILASRSQAAADLNG